jgi:anti-anti-sigma factor
MISGTFHLVTEPHEQGVVIRLSGRIDAASAAVLENKIGELLAQGSSLLLLDMAQVDYLSSAGMRVLLSATKKLQGTEGGLLCFSLRKNVMEIIRMAGFERILSLYPTEQEALHNRPHS